MRRESMTRTLLASTILLLGATLQPAVSLADPSRYPQYAQQRLPQGVEPEFIHLDEFVEEIRAGRRPLIVDVRSSEEYQDAHITGAVSIPLGDMAERLAEIPKDRSVVFY
jgi:3-mercaptopyruvate sulfurtransferase SseA